MKNPDRTPRLAILLGALMLMWPAFYNGWPLVFSDTGAFMFKALEISPIWDKPVAYAAFLHALSWRFSYWPAAFAQCLIIAHLVWLALRVLGLTSRPWYIATMIVLAAGSAAPWFVAQLMPDFLAPAMTIAVMLLAFADDLLSRRERWWLAFLIMLAAASHLAHLALLLGLLLVVLPCRSRLGLRFWPSGRAVAALFLPCLAAVGLIVSSNAVMHGQVTLSPYGAVFPLARQLATGPAKMWLEKNCPGAQVRLCGRIDQLVVDRNSDRVLWDRNSPLFADGDETVIMPDVRKILFGTLSEFPLEVGRGAARDTAEQFIMVRIGDALVPDHLPITVLNNLEKHLPRREAEAFRASRQFNGRLDLVPHFHMAHYAVLALSGLILLGAVLAGPGLLAPFWGMVLVTGLSLFGNAFICGVLSGPHDRYQARMIWLLPMLAMIALALIRQKMRSDARARR
ncbi:MAG: hypothetical protein IT557_03000 [Alphaproteobacteria bacterium]|nr:hypothetical protein [Alphaproteobacteria bacterium]